ncbi:hypothetical protein E2P64_00055 [Candidatus Bathyarchaeota archaeon]|nr:hypothetical protein E2P64_00055 [Candidatus Bathyarchaeota archaeon]
MKGVTKRKGETVFRVNLRFYPEKLVKLCFGKGEKVGDYLVFQGKFDEKEVYEGFNRMLEVLTN